MFPGNKMTDGSNNKTVLHIKVHSWLFLYKDIAQNTCWTTESKNWISQGMKIWSRTTLYTDLIRVKELTNLLFHNAISILHVDHTLTSSSGYRVHIALWQIECTIWITMLGSWYVKHHHNKLFTQPFQNYIP